MLVSSLEIPKRFFFRFHLRCEHLPRLWTLKDKQGLDETYRLPPLAEMEKQGPANASPIDFRIGWNEKGISFSLRIRGKKRGPWCKLTHPEESDGIQICLDTRDVRNVHRATRYCHRFCFLPQGKGPTSQEPVVFWFPIHRAKGHPNTVAVEQIPVRSELFNDGYGIDATLPGDLLTGFEPLEHSVLGFHYFVVDQEIGNHSMLVGPPFPHDQDPSLWGALECASVEK